MVERCNYYGVPQIHDERKVSCHLSQHSLTPYSFVCCRTLFLFNDSYLLSKPKKNQNRFVEMTPLTKAELIVDAPLVGKTPFPH
jgi:hypothetical protein